MNAPQEPRVLRPLTTVSDPSPLLTRRVLSRSQNESEYRAWNNYWNSIKYDSDGAFGVVNLLAPREESQGDSWRTEYTFVQLKIEFINAATGQPITLDRTFMSFYDFE